jgi:hypothetical protein
MVHMCTDSSVGTRLRAKANDKKFNQVNDDDAAWTLAGFSSPHKQGNTCAQSRVPYARLSVKLAGATVTATNAASRLESGQTHYQPSKLDRAYT